jgi:hypothetical protein
MDAGEGANPEQTKGGTPDAEVMNRGFKRKLLNNAND